MSTGSIRREVAVGATLALCAALATGCGSPQRSQSPTSSGSGGVPAAGATLGAGAPAGARLLSIHDPKQVTYSLHPANCHFLSGPRPDPSCTPGAIDPSVTQADIRQTICTDGYTKTVRPAESETEQAKHQQYQAYGVATHTTSELDHLVPLELGGSNDIANLWPEVGSIPNPKDKVEDALHAAVCDGRVQLAAAQQAIATDWTTAESVLGITDSSGNDTSDAGE